MMTGRPTEYDVLRHRHASSHARRAVPQRGMACTSERITEHLQAIEPVLVKSGWCGIGWIQRQIWPGVHSGYPCLSRHHGLVPQLAEYWQRGSMEKRGDAAGTAHGPERVGQGQCCSSWRDGPLAVQRPKHRQVRFSAHLRQPGIRGMHCHSLHVPWTVHMGRMHRPHRSSAVMRWEGSFAT